MGRFGTETRGDCGAFRGLRGDFTNAFMSRVARPEVLRWAWRCVRRDRHAPRSTLGRATHQLASERRRTAERFRWWSVAAALASPLTAPFRWRRRRRRVLCAAG